jgi:hypothetical protein
MIQQEGIAGDPDWRDKAWLDKLTDVEHKRSRLQDMAAEGTSPSTN